MSILINPITRVFVPFEVVRGRQVKRDDLPRFDTTEKVHQFMQRNPEIHQRGGKPIHLQWIEHDEDWALLEYHKGVGSAKWRLN